MVGWGQNGPKGDWLGGCGVYSPSSGRDHWRVLVKAVINFRILATRS
jgi:hypothetical protein